MDPFRLRSGIWLELPERSRAAVLRKLQKELAASIPHFEKFQEETYPIERVRVELGVAVQHARLKFVNAWLEACSK